VITDVEEYSQAAQVVTSMLDIDFASAVSMLERFQANARQVSANIDYVAKSGLADSNRRAEVVSASVASTTTIFTALSLLAVPLVALAAFLVGMATLRSIRAIATTSPGREAAGRAWAHRHRWRERH